jgi:hypothetical protein
MASNRIPQHRGRYLLEDMDGESFVYRPTAKRGIYLSETAAVIWKLCDGTRNVQQIIDSLVDIYPDAAHDVRVDVADTIDELMRIGALEMVNLHESPAAPVDRGNDSTRPG